MPRSRRSLLRTAGLALGVLGSGCASTGPSGSGEQTTEAPTTRKETTETITSEEPTASPIIDEQANTLPPGSPALETSGTWPTYRFDAGNTGSNLDGEGLSDGTVYWRLNAGQAATLDDGTLYNTFARGEYSGTELTYRDPATASIEARTRLVEYGVNRPPTVANGRVFVTTFIEVFCFDADSGEQLWRGPEMDGIEGPPTVYDGTVLVNTGGYQDTSPHLRAFDAENGDELWRCPIEEGIGSTPAADGERAFAASSVGLHAIDLASGEEEYVVKSAAGGIPPVVHGNTVYAIASDNSVSELVAVETTEKTVQWRTTVDTDSPPVVTDDVVYTRTEDGVTALNLTDGAIRESRSIYEDPSPVGLVGDVLYTAGDGTVLALNTANGLEQLWSLKTESVEISDTGGKAVYHVTPVNGAVYVSARDAFYGIGSA